MPTYTENQLYTLIASRLADFSNIEPSEHREVENALVQTMFELFNAVGNEAFDWDRPITTLPQKGQNLFSTFNAGTIAEGLAAMYFTFAPSALTIESISSQIRGINYTATVQGEVIINDASEVISEIRIYDNSSPTPLTTITPTNTGSNIPYSYNVSNLTNTITFRVEADTDNNGSPVTLSTTTTLNFLYPVLHGFDASSSPATPLNTLTKTVYEGGSETLPFGGTGYFHLYIPSAYGALSSAYLDNLRISDFENSGSSQILTTSGWDSNWTTTYNRYVTRELLLTQSSEVTFIAQ